MTKKAKNQPAAKHLKHCYVWRVNASIWNANNKICEDEPDGYVWVVATSFMFALDCAIAAYAQRNVKIFKVLSIHRVCECDGVALEALANAVDA